MAARSTKRGELGKSGTEARHVKRVKLHGGVSRKLVWPGRRHAPDRLDLYGVEAAARMYTDEHWGDAVPVSDFDRRLVTRMVAAAIQFTETKATGKKPRDGQLREHARLRAMGFKVNVVDA